MGAPPQKNNPPYTPGKSPFKGLQQGGVKQHPKEPTLFPYKKNHPTEVWGIYEWTLIKPYTGWWLVHQPI